MNSFFHSLADFELMDNRKAHRSDAPPTPLIQEVPALPSSPPSGRGRQRFVPLEDRLTRAVKGVMPKLGMSLGDVRLKKERRKDVSGGWHLEVQIKPEARSAGLVPASLGDAIAVVFELVPVDGSEEVTLEAYLVKPSTRVRLGRKRGAADPAGLEEMFAAVTRYASAGLIR